MHSAHTQNPGRAHTARAVPRSWELLSAQPTGRAHVARTASASRALAGRELVATRPGSMPQVATSRPGRDTKLTQPLPRQGRDVKSRSRPSWILPYVATSISCRDLVSTHSGIFKSRHKNPGRDLPHCLPCRDLKMMSRPQIGSALTLLCRDALFPCCDLPSAQPK